MYDKKYRLIKIEKLNSKYNPLHENIDGKVCYPAYFIAGERGWFLCDTEDLFNPVHRVHTSIVQKVEYTPDDQIIVMTSNTKYVFELIKTT